MGLSTKLIGYHLLVLFVVGTIGSVAGILITKDIAVKSDMEMLRAAEDELRPMHTPDGCLNPDRELKAEAEILRRNAERHSAELGRKMVALWFLWAFFMAAVIWLVYSFRIKKVVLQPLAELAEGTRRVAGGDLKSKVEIPPGDEFGVLGQSFNTMTARLKEAGERLAESERKYRDLVDYALVGVFSSTSEGRVLFANDALACMLDFPSADAMVSEGARLRYKDPPDRERLARELREKGVVTDFEFDALTKSGKVKRALMNATLEGDVISGMVLDITARKRAEEAYRKSENRHRALLNAIPDMILRISRDGVFLDFKAARDFPPLRPPNEFIGRGLKDLMPEDVARKGMEGIKRAIETGEEQVFGYDLLVKGEQRHYEARLAPNGEDEVLAIVRDVTQRRRTEEALRESEAAYRMLFEDNPHPMVVFDRETFAYLAVNEAAVRLYGYSREAFLGMTVKDTRPPEDIPVFLDSISRATDGLDMFGGTFRHRKKDGTVIDVEIAAHNIDFHGRRARLALVMDVTVRKRAEEALRESEEKFRTLAEKSPNMVFINKMGKVVYTNRVCEEVMGYRAEEFCAPEFDFMALVAPEDAGKVRQNFAKHTAGEEVPPYEYSLVTKKGRRIPVIISTKLITYMGERAILGIVTDISERKKAEEHLLTALREKEMLFREMNNRVKNNLMVISSILSLQSKGLEDKEAVDVFMEARNRVRSISLLHDMLSATGDPRKISFSAYVRNLTGYVFRSYGADTSRTILSVDVPDMAVDIETAIPCGLIINELVSNALRHAFPEGRAGEVGVAVERGDGGALVLAVKDSGVGLPEGFDVHSAGTLGMQIVRALVDQLQGSVEVPGGEGAEFRITFNESPREGAA